MTNDHHQSAKALIIKAAEKSGLLEQVAELLWFSSKAEVAMCCSGGTCPPCELLQQLTEDFDEHTCTPGIVCGDTFLCEGLSISPEDKAEASAFVG
jgi:hypothetical protein